MVSNEMLQLGTNPSAIRDLFEYGNKRKAEIGAENVFDFSIGNPKCSCAGLRQKCCSGIVRRGCGSAPWLHFGSRRFGSSAETCRICE